MSRPWVLLLLLPLLVVAQVPNEYIVELEDEPVLSARVMRPAEVRERQNRVRGEHRRKRSEVERAEGQVLDTIETVANALVVRIDDAKAARLRAIPGVKRVRRVHEYRMTLDHALLIHKVPEAWNRLGTAGAGAGIKIAILDSGIDIDHPGMQDAALTPPGGFPKVNADSDTEFTNSKVIVARSYANRFRRPETDLSARDRVGHGTAAAMAAAGVLNTGTHGPLSGVAPKAFLGSYKIFGSTGLNETTTSSLVLRALEDAVKDGMDVVNLSLGSATAPRLDQDIEVDAIERATAAGVLVVVSAGNEGPDPNTIGSPGTAPSAITVGASKNERTFTGRAEIEGGMRYAAYPGSGPRPSASVQAPVFDVAALDPTGLACSALPDESLAGRIALILRGTCTFEVKLTNALRAGAVAALVYTNELQPDPITMSVGNATLPASMLSYAGGIDLKRRLAENPSAIVSVSFLIEAQITGANGLASFSSRGPNVDEAIKPDLIAVGTDFYTAAERGVPGAPLYNASGYTVTQGTSFSAPIVAGAAAVLKAARPGLTSAQYRSLLINSAAPANARVQSTGGGLLDLDSALASTLTAAPASLNFRTGGADPRLFQTLTLVNVGASTTEYLLSAAPRDEGPAPVLGTDRIQLGPGQSANLTVGWTGASLKAGQYEGFILIADTNTGRQTRVPYWYGVPSDTPRYLAVLYQAETGRRAAQLRGGIVVRVTDASGIPMPSINPTVTVVSGDGEVVSVTSADDEFPGAFAVTVRLGPLPGANVFRVEVGDISRDVTISGN